MKKLSFILRLFLIAFAMLSCGKNTDLHGEDPLENLSFGTSETFEVLTWNLRDFPLKNSETIDELARLIPQMKVDLLAFQEIQDASALMELAQKIPYYSVLISNATNSYKLAYLYDERVISVHNSYTIFNGDSNPFPRPPYVLDFSWQGTAMIVVNNHLKAFGDNYIDENDPYDEEVRRRLACTKLDQHIRSYWDDKKVLVLGDMNDQIAEPEAYNVFMPFISRPQEYLFADMDIASNPRPSNVSYPPSFSHIDHILISNELFSSFSNPQSSCLTLQVEQALGSWQNYYNQISDHRPVALKLKLTD